MITSAWQCDNKESQIISTNLIQHILLLIAGRNQRKFTFLRPSSSYYLRLNKIILILTLQSRRMTGKKLPEKFPSCQSNTNAFSQDNK